MPEGSDPHDGQPSRAPAGDDRSSGAAQQFEPIRDGVAGIDPVRFGMLGASTFGALAAAWFLFAFVMAGLNDPIVLTDGPFGLSMREPDDLFLAVSNSYGLLVHVGPLLGIVLGLAVGRSVDTRTPGAVAGAFAVTVGAALTLFVLALCYVLVHPQSGAIGVLDVLEPAFASTLGIAISTIGGASAIGVFESLGEA